MNTTFDEREFATLDFYDTGRGDMLPPHKSPSDVSIVLWNVIVGTEGAKLLPHFPGIDVSWKKFIFLGPVEVTFHAVEKFAMSCILLRPDDLELPPGRRRYVCNEDGSELTWRHEANASESNGSGVQYHFEVRLRWPVCIADIKMTASRFVQLSYDCSEVQRYELASQSILHP